jgi:hypothetical protein
MLTVSAMDATAACADIKQRSRRVSASYRACYGRRALDFVDGHLFMIGFNRSSQQSVLAQCCVYGCCLCGRAMVTGGRREDGMKSLACGGMNECCSGVVSSWKEGRGSD